MAYAYAVILGIVEGLTEFLPISSTAHLILVGRLLNIDTVLADQFGGVSSAKEFLKTFDIVIQFGAILAVVMLYWRSFFVEWRVLLRVLAALVPTGLIAKPLKPTIKGDFMENLPLILTMLALGGIILIIFEKIHKEKPDAKEELSTLPWWQCVLIGCFQAISIVPGVSRAAATIIGGLILGWKRKTAVEFSFLLAVPTMAAASADELLDEGLSISTNELIFLLIGFWVSFIVAAITIVWLLHYVRSRTFIPFGIYRIAFAAILGLLLFGQSATG